LPRPKRDLIQIAVRLPRPTVELLDALAAQHGTTRSAALNALVEAGWKTVIAVDGIDRSLQNAYKAPSQSWREVKDAPDLD
jgi:predicted DNA-binding protein